MALTDKDLLGLPGAFKMPVADPTDRRALQTKGVITGMEQAGATERSTASDLSRLTGQLAPYGLSPGGLSSEVLERIRGQIGAERGANTVAGNVKGGVRIEKGTPPFVPGDTFKQKFTPGFMLPGAEQSANLPRLQSQETTGETIVDVTLTPEGTFAQRTRKSESQQQGKSRGGPLNAQRIEDLHARVTEMLTKREIPYGKVEIIDQNAAGTHISIRIDGEKPRVVKLVQE